MGKTSSAVKDRWNKEHYDVITLRVPKGENVAIWEAAKRAGKSINRYIYDAVLAEMAKTE